MRELITSGKFSQDFTQIEDEGLQILEAAMEYMEPKADADCEEQTGDFEAYRLLEMCADRILDEYTCRFCGTVTGERNTYCSRPCARADEAGV